MDSSRNSIKGRKKSCRELIGVITFLSFSMVSSLAKAQSADEIVRDFGFTYMAAATTYHLCIGRVTWNREYDDARIAEVEAQLAALNVPESEWRGLMERYTGAPEVERDLYNYYKSQGIKFFLGVKEFGHGLILNATSGGYYDDEARTEFPRSLKEFCDLAEKEMNTKSAIGKYYKQRIGPYGREFLSPWSDE